MEIVNSIKIFLRNLKWKLGIHQNFNNPHYSGIYGEWVGKNYLKKKDIEYILKIGEAYETEEMKLI